MTAILIILVLLLALFGEPLFIIIGAIALIGFYFVADLSSAVLIGEIYRLANAPLLMAIPLFTFAGYIMAESRTPARLVRVSQAFLGWMPGGLAVVALVSCAVFTALTGASGVTIIALGGFLYPALLKDRYPERFSLGLLTSSGSLGLLFPPSLPIIIYGLVAQVDVDKLFRAGALPGILIVILLSIYSIFKGLRSDVPRSKVSLREIGGALREAAWEIPLPFVILVGIYGGFFTVSDAAAICAVYVIIVEVLIYRDIKLRQVPKIMVQSMVLVGGIFVILGVALGFCNFLIDQRIPMKALELIKEHIHSRITFLIMLNVFLLVVGCLMDIFSAIIVVVPLIVPIATAFGVNPIHLGIIFLTNLEIGYSTPPVGLNLFISSFRFRKPIVTLYRAAVPFLIILIIALIIITYVPGLSLWLVNLGGG